MERGYTWPDETSFRIRPSHPAYKKINSLMHDLGIAINPHVWTNLVLKDMDEATGQEISRMDLSTEEREAVIQIIKDRLDNILADESTPPVFRQFIEKLKF
jgi:hypothetical protein